MGIRKAGCEKDESSYAALSQLADPGGEGHAPRGEDTILFCLGA